MIYYGYRRGDNDKVVDWSSVSGELTENLRNIEQEREKERNRIEGEIAEATNSINDVPMGNYESMNSFILGASNQAAEQLRIQSRLLRNGQMKPSQFARFRQNLLDGMSGYKKVADSYNAKMDEFVTRQQDMTAGQLEAYSAKMLENTANLQNMVSFVDPVTGMVMNAPKDKDGKPIMDQAMSPRDMLNLAAQKYDRFDMNAQLDPIVEKYGREIQVLKSGGVLTKSDILQRRFGASKKTMDEVIDDTMKQYTPEQLSSVLLDHAGGYKVTNDPKQRDANPDEYILIGRDGSLANRLSPELTPDQTDKARKLIKEQLLTKLDLVETPYTPPTQSASATSAAQKRQKDIEGAKNNMNRLLEMFSGDDEKKKEVLDTYSDALRENYKGFMEARIEGDELVIVHEDRYGDEYTERLSIPDDPESFIKTIGPKLTGDDNLIGLLNEASQGIDFDQYKKQKGEASYKVERKEDPSQELPNWLQVSQTLPEIQNTYLLGGRDAYVEEVVSDYVTKSGIKGLDYSISGDTLTLNLKGLGSVTVDISMGASANRKVKIKEALRKVHEAATTGEPLSGGSMSGGSMSGF